MFSKHVNSNTRENSSDGALNQSEKKKSKINYDPPVKELSDIDILTELEKTVHCCGYGGSLGCIRKTFSDVTDGVICLDINKAIQIVRLCRSRMNWRDQENFNQYAEQLFRDCIDKKLK